MTASNDIARLLPVLETAFQAEQMRMAKVNRRIADLNAKMRDLDRPLQSDPLAPAQRAGMDTRWATWAQERKKLINQELAAANRERETIKLDMIAALSKREAARRMQLKAQADAARIALARASW